MFITGQVSASLMKDLSAPQYLKKLTHSVKTWMDKFCIFRVLCCSPEHGAPENREVPCHKMIPYGQASQQGLAFSSKNFSNKVCALSIGRGMPGQFQTAEILKGK